MRSVLPALSLVAALLPAPGLQQAVQAGAPTHGEEALPGHIIVRYREAVAPVPQPGGAKLTGSPSLDALQASLGVRSARPLFSVSPITYEILNERHRSGSIVVTSNRGPDEWLATFADPLRAQSAIDRFVNNAYDLVLDGESYRRRQKPSLDSTPTSEAEEAPRKTRLRRR